MALKAREGPPRGARSCPAPGLLPGQTPSSGNQEVAGWGPREGALCTQKAACPVSPHPLPAPSSHRAASGVCVCMCVSNTLCLGVPSSPATSQSRRVEPWIAPGGAEEREDQAQPQIRILGLGWEGEEARGGTGPAPGQGKRKGRSRKGTGQSESARRPNRESAARGGPIPGRAAERGRGQRARPVPPRPSAAGP